MIYMLPQFCLSVFLSLSHTLVLCKNGQTCKNFHLNSLPFMFSHSYFLILYISYSVAVFQLGVHSVDVKYN